MRTALQFGAGSVGRGFMGQLFCESGLETVFVDVRPDIIAALNRDRSYLLRIAAEPPETQTIAPVRAIDGRDAEVVAREVQRAEIVCTAVGLVGLPGVCVALGPALLQRERPINVIVCENLPRPAETVRALLLDAAPELQTAFGRTVGIVEAVVGRMVPVQDSGADILEITAEAYKHLPVNARGVVSPVPSIVGLELCEPFEAYVAQKLFVHNAAHAAIAYAGYQAHRITIDDAMEDAPIRNLAEEVMRETGDALVKLYGLGGEPMRMYRQDLLRRFANGALKDTVARVARDPKRKLGPEERLIGGARLVLRSGGEPAALVQAVCAALRYDDPSDPSARQVQEMLRTRGLLPTLSEIAGLTANDPLTERIMSAWNSEANA